MALPLYGAKARLSRTDLASATVRIAVSALLIWGALTKLLADERLETLAGAWGAAGLPEPQLLVTASISLQLVLAALLFVGLFARVIGPLSAVNFTAAATISGIFASSHWWAFALLFVLLMHFGIAGAGGLSIDALRSRRGEARSLDEMMASLGIKPSTVGRNPPGN